MVAVPMIVTKKFCCQCCHPTTDSCFKGILETFRLSSIGTLKFLSVLAFLQIVAKYKKLTRKKLIHFMKYNARLFLCATLVSTNIVIFTCLQNRIFGQIYPTTILISSFLASVSIFVLPSKERYLITSAVYVATLEVIFRGNRIKYSKLRRTLAFAVINSLYMYLLSRRKTNVNGNKKPVTITDEHNNTNEENRCLDKVSTTDTTSFVTVPIGEIWFFRPEFSNGLSSFKCLSAESMKYFVAGLLLQKVQITIANFSKFLRGGIRNFVRNFRWSYRKLYFRKSTFTLATFAGLYVFIFKFTVHWLTSVRHKSKIKSMINPIAFAGFLSGLSFFVKPELSTTLTVLVNVLFILCSKYAEKLNLYFDSNPSNGNNKFRTTGVVLKLVHGIFTNELPVMIMVGYMIHKHLFYATNRSKFFDTMLYMATNGQIEKIIYALRNGV